MAERRLIFEDPRVAQPYVMRSYLAPERDSGAQGTAAALTILAALLGDGTNSVLTRKLQFESEVSLYSSAWYSGLSLDDTTFNLVVVPAPGTTLQQAEAALETALAEFMVEGVDAEHMERIKMQARASQIYARDDVGDLAQRYGRALTQGLSVSDVQAWPDVLQAVTEEDVMQAARQVFVREYSVTGWLKAPEVTQ